MPLDIAPAEFAATDVDDDTSDSPSSHHEEKPSLLAAMKQAGGSLIKRVKRAGTKQILSLMMAAGAALGATSAAKAQSVQYVELDGTGNFQPCVLVSSPTGGCATSPTLSGPVKVVLAFDPSFYSQAANGYAFSVEYPGGGTYTATAVYATPSPGSPATASPWTLVSATVNGQNVTAELTSTPSTPSGSLVLTQTLYEATDYTGSPSILTGNALTDAMYLNPTLRSITTSTGLNSGSLPSSIAYTGFENQTNISIFTPTLGVVSNSLVAGLGYVSSLSNGDDLEINVLSDDGQYPPFSENGYILQSSITSSTLLSGPPLPIVTPPKTLGDPNKGDCGCAGDPITIGTGNVFEQVADYTTTGQNPLVFTRYYNSLQNSSNPNSLASTMGTNWRSNYDRYLNIVSSSAISAERPDGQVLNFTLIAGTWTSDTDEDYTLTPQSGSTWTLTDHNDTIETYSVTSGKGTLTSIEARNGYTQNLSYSGALLNSVTDSYDRSLTFTYYSSGLMDTVTTPDGLVLTYGFTAAAGGNQLTSVSYNTSTASSQTYLYENVAYPFALTGIKDENLNRFATWGYDTQGRGISSQHGTGTSTANLTTLAYNSDGTTTVTNAFNVADTYTFTSLQGVPKVTAISRTAPSGTTVSSTPRTIGYDGNGYLSTSTDWNGNVTNWTNDIYGDPTTIVEAAGSSVSRTTTIAYGASSGMCTTNVRLLCTITTAGLTSGFPGDSPEQITFTYDGSGNVASRTEQDNITSGTPTRTWGFSWYTTGANIGLLHTVTGPRTSPDASQTTTFAYPPTGSNTGALTSITTTGTDLSTSFITSFTYSGGGTLPMTVTDPNNVLTALTYDARLNLNTSKLDPLGTAGGPYLTTYVHDAANRLMSITQPDLSLPATSFAFSYDTANRLTQIKNANSETINYGLDALGDVTGVTINSSPGSGSTTTLSHTASFDALGRMLTSVGASGQTTTFGYDANSNLTSIVDPRANASSSSYNTTLNYDALNRPYSVTDRNGYTTSATYDAHDQVTKITDPNTNQTTYTRDGFERVIQLASPDSNTTTFVYDPADNMTKMTAGITSTSPGVVTNRSFDAVNREVTRTFPGNAAEDVYKTYDQVGAFGFGIGHLTTMSNTPSPTSSTLYTRYIAYDERGNDIGGSDVYGGGAVTFNNWKYYDGASRLTAVILPSGWAQGWFRDAAGQVTGVGVQPSPYTAPVTMVAGSNGSSGSPITHMPFGPVASIPFANGITQTNAYDQDYRLTSLTDTYTPTSSTLRNLSYAYDANDNLGGTTGTPGITDNLNSANNQTMTYDRMDRLASAAGSYGSYGWTYDPNGNRATQTLNGGTPDTYNYNSGTNQLNSTTASGFSVIYDGAGATTQVSQTGIGVVLNSQWNQSEQQSSVTNSAGAPLASYSYDGFGQRLVKTTTVATVFSYGKFGNLTEESNANPQTTDYIPLDPSSRREAFISVGMVAIPANPTSSSTALYFMHTDQLGTPQKVTDGASPPNVQWSTTYTPFGAAASAITNPNNITQNLRLPGMYSDPETGLYHNGAREYVPTTGLYFKTDPIGLAAGTNPYQYAKGNPFRYTDRLGLDPTGAPFSGSGGFGNSQSGKYNLFNPNDPNSDIFNAQPSIPGVLIIGGHGNPLGIQDPNSISNPPSAFTAEDIANQILMATNPDGSSIFSPDTQIWLQSCQTGRNPDAGYLGSNQPSFAQQLANILGTTVWAPAQDSVFDSDVGEPLRWLVGFGGRAQPFVPAFKY